MRRIAAVLFLPAALVSMEMTAYAQFTQQGQKLDGADASGKALQGASVALSTDGNTLLEGGYRDLQGNTFVGAAWVFTRSAGVWTQQGPKLVGTGWVGDYAHGVYQGYSVALSADGNTALVGAYGDSNFTGAAWIFVRTDSGWVQQGGKLVGTGAKGSAYQGLEVALSADGNTALIGGPYDSLNAGAAWVFARTGSGWVQQGGKLVGTGAVGAAYQGYPVALSADGNTAIIGGDVDNNGEGASWVFTRSGGVWTQQGNKLVGSGGTQDAHEGSSVSLSADGNTAIVGGAGDNNGIGALWAFTRSGGVWTQQGEKMVGTGEVGSAGIGSSVSLSTDGNSAITGGYGDSAGTGAAWIFTRSGGVWSQEGTKLVGGGYVRGPGYGPYEGYTVSISGDGSTAAIGGPEDDTTRGAAWIF